MVPDQEFREFGELLEFHGVRFEIIGGYAVISHGYPRYTGDTDFLVENSPVNARRLVSAINDCFGNQPHIAGECFLDHDRMEQFGDSPFRIDILVKVPGLVFSEVYSRHGIGKIAGKDAPFLSLPHLIKSKQPAARKQDLADLEALEEIETASHRVPK